ncbi:epimerase [Flexivirga endophytica]|uniref:Epimerase n=1 Tax=Flexivirga endophytica TaxID=1849103 RepID=A0A916T003_9MICO|nr:NAD(P)-dependent oxidoreductase [Flexivirga endophytica]GGB22356.1 epimerase [Flexivirga endophytica]GHB56297.1 epimerase [Flexivirga endophytica]
MRVLLAGATGAVGRPLTTALQLAGHEVVALTRDPARADGMTERGVTPVIADALDRDALLRAADGVSFDAVVHQLTALRKPPVRHSGMTLTNTLRTIGTRNLLELAIANGAKRFVTQSIVFGYGYTDHGPHVLTEDAPFGGPVKGRTAPHVRAMGVNEQLVLEHHDLDGMALRYGLFYGGDDMAQLLRARKVPVPRDGGHLAWIHLDDAVSATVAALEKGSPGSAYNIVDDEPASWRTVMTALAKAYGAPAPRVLPAWLLRLGAPYAGAVALDTSLHVSSAKARRELDWAPAHPTVRHDAAVIARTR